MVRAAHGMVAAALSSLGIYYQIQAPAGETPPEGADHRDYRVVARHSGPSVFDRTAAAGRVARALFLRAGSGADLPRLRNSLKTAAGRQAQGL